MRSFKISIILFLCFNHAFSQSVRINEVAASNTIFFDEDGDSPDWIELYNFGNDEISLNNWSLSDLDLDDNPWVFPEITIDADEYLLVWASDKDRSDIFFTRTLINQGDSFKYIIPDENTPSDWTNLDFNDD